MNEENGNGAAIIASILRWHLRELGQAEADMIGAEIWAWALKGDLGATSWLAGETARKVAGHIEEAGGALGRFEKKDMTNKIMAELTRVVSIRGARDTKPRPHLFRVAPYDDMDADRGY